MLTIATTRAGGTARTSPARKRAAPTPPASAASTAEASDARTARQLGGARRTESGGSEGRRGGDGGPTSEPPIREDGVGAQAARVKRSRTRAATGSIACDDPLGQVGDRGLHLPDDRLDPAA